MRRKALSGPEIPEKLEIPEDAMLLFREAKISEEEITTQKIKSFFITKFDGKGLRFNKTVFENCRFINCCLEETTFVDVIFKSCDFSNTGMTNAYFKNCGFYSCKGIGTDFYGSVFRRISFQQCNFSEAVLDGSKMNYVSMESVNLESASLSKCMPNNLELKRVNFRNANFFKTTLKGLDVSDCEMEGIGISDTREELQGAVMNMAQALDCAKRLGIVIKG